MFVVHFIGHSQKICKPGFEKNLRKIRSLIFHEAPQEVKYFPQPFRNRHFCNAQPPANLFHRKLMVVVQTEQFAFVTRQGLIGLP